MNIKKFLITATVTFLCFSLFSCTDGEKCESGCTDENGDRICDACGSEFSATDEGAELPTEDKGDEELPTEDESGEPEKDPVRPDEPPPYGGEGTEPSEPDTPLDPTEPEGPSDPDNPEEPDEPSSPEESNTPLGPPKPYTYIEYMNLTAEEQRAFVESFPSIYDFVKWFNEEKEKYDEENRPPIIDGDIDLGG